MSAPTRDAVLDALRKIQDPDLFKDIVTLGFVRDVVIEGGKVKVNINLTNENRESLLHAEIPILPAQERRRRAMHQTT